MPHNGELCFELMAFRYEYQRNGVGYSAPSATHDDRVIALVLAASKLQKANRPGHWGSS
jgi:hypothetical protein